MAATPHNQASTRNLVLGLGAAVLIGYFVMTSFKSTSAAKDEAEAFLQALNSGQVSAGYDALSSGRRARMSPEAFAALTDHPAFRHHTDFWLGPVESQDDGLCILCGIDVDGRQWGVQVFLVEEQGRQRVHSFALQPPASMQLGTLLPECGFWEGTTTGYSGPGIERNTTPTN